jgi:hypothetical protein
MVKPINMATPPNDAMGLVCSFRASGKSNSFFWSATLMIAGITNKVIPKAMETGINTFSIQQGFGC